MQDADIFVERAHHGSRPAATHDLDDEEITHHDGDDKDRPKRDAVFGERQHDEAHDVEAAGASV